MDLFDKKYVYCMWDDALEGKKGFVADSINDLQQFVRTNSTHYEAEVEDDGGDMAYPFKSSEGVYYRFFYYDPNYAVKLAFAKGAKIQYRHRELSLTDSWRDIDNPTWSDTMEYRIKKQVFMTYRQLAEWLARGHGEAVSEEYVGNVSNIIYPEDKKDEEVASNYRIRYWSSNEWIEPRIEVYQGDCR